MNTIEDGICRTILSTYHKVGTFNVFKHNFPAVMEVYEDGDSDREPVERYDHPRMAFRADISEEEYEKRFVLKGNNETRTD